MRSDNGRPPDWREVRLQEFATLQRGFDLPIQKRISGTVPVYAANGPVGYHDTPKVEGPGVITGRSGTIGEAMYTKSSFWPLNTALYVKDFHGNEPEYVYRVLTGLGLEKFSSGTGVPTLNRNVVHKQRILVPRLPVQRKIVEILNAIDDASEATQAVIKQTRQLKTALLQDLLTNGLFGRHKEFKNVRGLGRIPASWVPTQLGDHLAEPIRNGYSPLSPNLPTGHWVTTLSAVSAEGYQQTGVKPAPPNDHGVLASVLHLGDILVSRSNTRALVGLAGIYDGTPSPCSYSDLLMRVRPDERRILKEYVLLCLLSQRGRAYFEKTARGTSGSMKKIDHNILENLPIPLPSLVEQREIIQVVDAVSKRLSTTADEFRQLQSMKVTLSQGLLTGRIPVTGGEEST